MKNVHDLFAAWPALSSLAADIGVSYNTAKHMKRRGSIPARYWPLLVRSAEARGIQLTYDQLFHIHLDAQTASEVA